MATCPVTRQTRHNNGLSQGTASRLRGCACEIAIVFEPAFDWKEKHSLAVAQFAHVPQVRASVSVEEQTKLGFLVIREAESEGLYGFPVRVHDHQMLLP